MNIAIRADSSENIGTGHIVRCISLAKELRKLGFKVFFISKLYKGNIIKLIKRNKFFVKGINPNLDIKADILQTSKVIKVKRINFIILDNYQLNLAWEKKIRKKVKKLIIIDDFIKFHFCDVLINSNLLSNNKKIYYNLYKKKINKTPKFLLGLKYAVLDENYLSLKKKIILKKKIKKINIFFGGFRGSTKLIDSTVDVLSNKIFQKIKLDIVLGLNQKINKKLKRKLNIRGNYKIFSDLPNLCNLFKSADLAIGSGGTTTFERLCLGLPSLVYIAAKNQNLLTNNLKKKSLIIKIKKTKNNINKKNLFNIVNNLKKTPGTMRKISKQSKSSVDGYGAKRIAKVILKMEKK